MLLKHKESAEVRAEAAGAVYCLADGHENNKTSIASAGGIKPLITLLGSGMARAQV